MTEQAEPETKKLNWCNDGWSIRVRYLFSGSEFDKNLWIHHLRACPQCRAHFAALTAQAENAVMPEVEP